MIEHDNPQPWWRNRWRLPGAGAIIVLIGASISPEILLDLRVWTRSYIFALFFWLNLALGALIILMLHELTPGRWGEFIHESRKAAASTLPVLALLFIPLLPACLLVFPWSPLLDTSPELSATQRAYLGFPWFTFRTVFILSGWILTAAIMRCWRPARQPPALGRQAAAGMVFLIPSITLFSVDWILSLQPGLADTMIGFAVVSGQISGGLAMAVIYAYLRCRRFAELSENDITRFQDLGNLLLSSVMFYAYIIYMHFLIIWSGNLPDEISWFTTRSDATGLAVIGLLVLLHIALPTALLMSRRIKRSPGALFIVAVCVILGRWLDIYWLFKPLYRYGGPVAVISDLFLLILIGCIWLGIFNRTLKKEYSFVSGPNGTVEHGH